MKRRSAALALLLLVGNAQAATPADYAWLFPLATPDADAGAWRVDLTPEVYARIHDADLRDLEVFNATGQAVPFSRIATAATPTTSIREVALPLLALPADARTGSADLRVVIERDAGGRLQRIDAGETANVVDAPAARQWLADAGALDCTIERIVLAWDAPATDLVARFDIEAGDDLQSWHRIGSGSVLALEQQGARLERRDILLDGSRHAWLRLHRRDDGAAFTGLRAKARCIEHDAGMPARSWLDALPEAGDDRKRHAYALPAMLPVSGARVSLGNDNALADLTLSARDPLDPARWTPLARQTAFRLRAGADTLRNGDIEFGTPLRRREFRLDAATPLASAPQLALAWTPDRFVFLAEGEGPYLLAVGSARARRADYPVDAALASLRSTLGREWQPPQAAIGDGREGAGVQALRKPPPPLQWGTWLLWGALVAGAALVVGFTLTLLRAKSVGAPGEKPQD